MTEEQAVRLIAKQIVDAMAEKRFIGNVTVKDGAASFRMQECVHKDIRITVEMVDTCD